MAVACYITYEDCGGQLFGTARVTDTATVRLVARRAIAEAKALAFKVRSQDELLGDIQESETHRLTERLRLLLPGLEDSIQ